MPRLNELNDVSPSPTLLRHAVGGLIRRTSVWPLRRLLVGIIETLDSEKLASWNRSLPSGELVNDRWRRARRLGFGEGSSIYDSSIVVGNVRVGSRTWIGPFTILDGSGGLQIGANCSISSGVHIYSHDTVDFALTGGTDKIARKSVRIGDNCYIGPNTVVSMGVTIGDGATIGACSFVNSDVGAGSRVAGVPARPI